jgi:hypothetical protein
MQQNLNFASPNAIHTVDPPNPTEVIRERLLNFPLEPNEKRTGVPAPNKSKSILYLWGVQTIDETTNVTSWTCCCTATAFHEMKRHTKVKSSTNITDHFRKTWNQ